jgi:hypothetical protein
MIQLEENKQEKDIQLLISEYICVYTKIEQINL